MENTELIEQYLDGHLGLSEQAALEARLLHEPALAEEVALQRRLREGIRLAGRRRVLSRLEATEAQMSAYHPPAQGLAFDDRTRQRFYWAAAAALLLLIPAYLWLRASSASAAHEKLFARYFTPYENPAVGSAAQDPLGRALQQYRAKNYAQALPILQSLTGSGPAADSALFYKANVHLQIYQPAEAIQTLQQVPAASPLHPAAQWYLALARLLNNEGRAARTLAAGIARTPGHPYQAQARTLAADLK